VFHHLSPKLIKLDFKNKIISKADAISGLYTHTHTHEHTQHTYSDLSSITKSKTNGLLKIPLKRLRSKSNRQPLHKFRYIEDAVLDTTTV
jgi:hypothetical protein